MLNNIYIKISSNKHLVLNIFGAIGVRGLALIVSLITLPAYMSYFPNQQILGVWFSILGILNWILIFDLGIGNGLRNNLVHAFVNKDNIKAKKYISSSYINIGIISLLIFIVGYVCIGAFDWNSILNIKVGILDTATLVASMRLVFAGVVTNFFLKIIISILYAMQKSALSNFISLISNSLILIYTVLANNNNNNFANSLLSISFVYILTINIPLLVSTFVIFMGPLKEIRPSIKYYSKDLSKNIMNLGFTFFWIQITLLIINSTNEFIIAKLFSPEAVVEYQVYYKLLSLPLMFFSILTIPIWSAVTKAFSENKIQWIKKTYKVLNLSAILISLIYVISIPIIPSIFKLWLGNNLIDIEYNKIVLFVIFNCVMILIYSSTSIANGIGNLKLQFVLNSIAAIIKIPLSLLLYKFINSWEVIIIVNIIIMIPLAIYQPILNKKTLDVLKRKINNKNCL